MIDEKNQLLKIADVETLEKLKQALPSLELKASEEEKLRKIQIAISLPLCLLFAFMGSLVQK